MSLLKTWSVLNINLSPMAVLLQVQYFKGTSNDFYQVGKRPKVKRKLIKRNDHYTHSSGQSKV